MAAAEGDRRIPGSVPRSIDVFIPIEEGTSKHVHFQLLQGDITTEDTQAVVVFRSPNDTAEGDSLRVLQAAGDGIEAEYHNAKAQGGRHVAKGVVLTGAGNLAHPRHILHLLVDGNDSTITINNKENHAKLRETLITALRVADKYELKSLTFPPLLHNSSRQMIKTMLDSFDEFTRSKRPICLHFIQIVIQKYNRFTQYMETRQRIDFELYNSVLYSETNLFQVGGFTGLFSGKETPPPTDSIQVSSTRKLHSTPNTHVKLNHVNVHVTTGRANVNETSRLSFVTFRHTKEERSEQQFPPETSPNLDKVLSDTKATVLTPDISIKMGGTYSLFEITIDDDPGKFPRVRTAIQTTLRLADQRGITHIILPSKFHYGDDQIPSSRFKIIFDKKRPSMIFPCLYLQAIHDFALYDQPSSLHTIYIRADNHDIDIYKEVRFDTSFRALFITLDVDPILQACHLSAVKENYRVIRKRWKWGAFSNDYYRAAVKTTNCDRYTYGCALQQISPVEVPSELLYTSDHSNTIESMLSDPETDSLRMSWIYWKDNPTAPVMAEGRVAEDFKDVIIIDRYVCKNRHERCTKNILWLEETLQPPPPPPSAEEIKRIRRETLQNHGMSDEDEGIWKNFP